GRDNAVIARVDRRRVGLEAVVASGGRSAGGCHRPNKLRVVATVARSRVAALDQAIGHDWRAVIINDRAFTRAHPVAPDDAVANLRCTIEVVDPGTLCGGSIAADRHIGQGWAATSVVDAAAVGGGIA